MKADLSMSGDRLFTLIVIILMVGGIAIFCSAALGLLARTDGAPGKLALTQLLLGLVPGVIALIAIRMTPHLALLRAVIPAYVISIILCLLVFIPHVGLTLNGATRWINLGFTTFQPAELIKITTVLMLAAYLAHAKGKLHTMRYGFLPFAIIVGLPILLLILQPNNSTVLIISITSTVLYFLAGAPLKHLGMLLALAVVGAIGVVLIHPYVLQRVETFIHPSHDSLQSGYQIQQSLIAIGSGELFGRGFGQSVQKFNYLPEPVGDSVFAVFSEEFGFVGAVLLILLFIAFATRGFAIAGDAANTFGSLTVTGLTLIIVLSAFLNIGAMLGILPLTGLPLPFVSHGGTALLATLASIGIILNIASHKKRKA